MNLVRFILLIPTFIYVSLIFGQTYDEAPDRRNHYLNFQDTINTLQTLLNNDRDFSSRYFLKNSFPEDTVKPIYKLRSTYDIWLSNVKNGKIDVSVDDICIMVREDFSKHESIYAPSQITLDIQYLSLRIIREQLLTNVLTKSRVSHLQYFVEKLVFHKSVGYHIIADAIVALQPYINTSDLVSYQTFLNKQINDYMVWFSENQKQLENDLNKAEGDKKTYLHSNNQHIMKMLQSINYAKEKLQTLGSDF